MKAKPRGSTSGLLKHHSSQKINNTTAMLEVITKLKIERPTAKWTYKDVWATAGLKSQIALNSAWNQHIRAEIDAHNSYVDQLGSEQPNGAKISVSEKQALALLRTNLKNCKSQRDQALARISQLSADVNFFRKKCEDLEQTVLRLRGNL